MTTNPARSSLSTYLDDHRAGAAAGEQLARRLADMQRDAPCGEQLGRLANEIRDDVQTLDAVRDALHVDGGRMKRAVALAGGLVARWCPDRLVLHDDHLTLVRDLEAMASGIVAKRHLWTLLAELSADRRLAAFDFDELAQRADRQLAALGPVHRAAADAMLGGER